MHFLGFVYMPLVFVLSFHPTAIMHLWFAQMWVFKPLFHFCRVCFCFSLFVFWCLFLSPVFALFHSSKQLVPLLCPKEYRDLGWMKAIQTWLDLHTPCIRKPSEFPNLLFSCLVWLLLRYYPYWSSNMYNSKRLKYSLSGFNHLSAWC